jgi:hypothetical protein
MPGHSLIQILRKVKFLSIQVIRLHHPLCMTVSSHHSFSPSFGSLYILSLPSSVNLSFFTFFIVLFKHTFRPVLLLVVHIQTVLSLTLRPTS